MNFHDPSRPRLANGRPAWLGAPQVALPGLYITPLPGGSREFSVEVIVEGSWVEATLPDHQLRDIALAWESDPENCLKAWFRCEPPGAPIIARASAEDLGL